MLTRSRSLLDVSSMGVGASPPHESAHLHVTGEATYADDIPELRGTLHAALGLSPVARGRLNRIERERLAGMPGVVSVLTAEDIPGVNDCGSIQHDEPILAAWVRDASGALSGDLRYLGQPVFVVVATDRDLARRAAALADQVLAVDPLPPMLDPLQAQRAGDCVVPVMHLRREQHDGAAAEACCEATHRMEGRFVLGGQEQFYLEGQISYAIPGENETVLVHCSTQHPTEMQHLVAHALGWQAHQVQVSCRRMGGGFGGKESQSAPFACIAAVAAVKLRRPVKLRLDRDDDFMVTGRRHCFWTDYRLGFDADGRLLGAEACLTARAGHSTDLSPPVMTRALCHFDNAYWIPNIRLEGHCARTNTQSNTAFRGFGGPQGALTVEVAMERMARRLGVDPLDLRKKNFYAAVPGDGSGQGSHTPYGQVVRHNLIHDLVERLEVSSQYRERRQAVAVWNATQPVLKRGLALTPVKFGIAFNVKHFNQAGALVHVYADGSVLVNHGGTEMGQGLNTKVAQVVAEVFGIPLSRVRCTATDTQKVVNTSATAASTGSDLNGKAAEAAARTVRDRLAALAGRLGDVPAEQVHFANGAVTAGAWTQSFDAFIQRAYLERIQLWSDGFYVTPGLSWDRETLTGEPFHYFAFGAAVSEVVVDVLTGEHRLLRADLLHDVGSSLNPALDIGQVEGAFIQGMGWLTMEELVWHPQSGKLMTHAPSTYKIPTANDCPPVLRTALYGASNEADTIFRSKAVGEPPLLLAFSVFLAIRDAIASVGGAHGDPDLRAPATPEAVLDALASMGATGLQPLEASA